MPISYIMIFKRHPDSPNRASQDSACQYQSTMKPMSHPNPKTYNYTPIAKCKKKSHDIKTKATTNKTITQPPFPNSASP